MAVIAQLRTTDLEGSIRFYTQGLGFELDFRYEDFYAGIRAGAHVFHLKHVDAADPSIAYVAEGEHFHLYFDIPDVDARAAALQRNGIALAQPPRDTAWGTRELVVKDDQGHTLYFGQTRR